MKIKFSREARIGGLVILALAVGFWGFNFLKGFNIFASHRTFYAIYNKIDGISVGSAVKMNGLNVGSVTSVELMPDHPGRLLVKFRVSNSQLNIPKDTEARIESSGLIGSTYIQLNLGSLYDTPAKSGDTLRSQTAEDLMSSVNKMLTPVKDKVERLIVDIDSILVPIQAVLSPKTVTSISSAIHTIPDIINNIERTTANLDRLIRDEKEKIGRILTNVESISGNLKKNNDKITNILANVESISDSLAKANFKQTIQKATDAIAKVDDIMTKVNNGEGTLGMLVSDKKLYYELDSIAKNLNSLVEDLQANPHRYVHFSVFGRRDKAPKKKNTPSNNAGN